MTFYNNGFTGYPDNNINLNDHNMAGYGDLGGLGVQTGNFSRPATGTSNQGSDDGGFQSAQMPRQSSAYDGSAMGYSSFAWSPQNNYQNSPQESYSLSQETSPVVHQTGFQQQQQFQPLNQQLPMGISQSNILPPSEPIQQAVGFSAWPLLQQPPQLRLLTVNPQQQPFNSQNADYTGTIGAGSFGSGSPQGYTPAGVGTPVSIGFQPQVQIMPGGRQPSYTPDTGHTSQFNEPDTMYMGGGTLSPDTVDPPIFPDTPASQPYIDLDMHMPFPSFGRSHLQTAVDEVVTRDAILQSDAANRMIPTPQDRLRPPTHAQSSARRLSCSTIDSDNSYANVSLPRNNQYSSPAAIPTVPYTMRAVALPSSQPTASTTSMRADPLSSVPERGANKSAIPADHLNTFKMNTSKKRRETDEDSAPASRRQKRDAKRACIACYLTRKKCEGGTPCSKCKETVACGLSGNPQCFSSRFEDQNIFLQCLPDVLKKRVADVQLMENWKTTRADRLLGVNLEPALEVLSMEKLGHKNAYRQSVERINFERDAVFGPMHKVCLLLQGRHVFKKNTEGSTFQYTAKFEENLMVLRAFSAHRVFHMVEHRMEKNKIGSTVKPGSRRACILTTILGMLLEHTLGFHNSLPATTALDETLEESRRQLAYHLAHRLQFMAKRALKETNQNVEKYVEISSKMEDIKVDGKLWVEINEAHDLHDKNDAEKSARGEPTLQAVDNGWMTAHSNTPLSSIHTPGVDAGTEGSPEHRRSGGFGPMDASGSSQDATLWQDIPQVTLRSATWEGATMQVIGLASNEETTPRRGRRSGEDLAAFDDDRENYEVRELNRIMMTQDDPIDNLMAEMSLNTPSGLNDDENSSSHQENETQGDFDAGTGSGSHISEGNRNEPPRGDGAKAVADEFVDFRYNADISTMGEAPESVPAELYIADDFTFNADADCFAYGSPSDLFTGGADILNETWDNARQNPEYQINYDEVPVAHAGLGAGGSSSFTSDSIPRTSNDLPEASSSPTTNILSRGMSLRRQLSKSHGKGKEIVSGFLSRSHSRSSK